MDRNPGSLGGFGCCGVRLRFGHDGRKEETADMRVLPVSDTGEREAHGSGGFGLAHAGAGGRERLGSAHPRERRSRPVAGLHRPKRKR
jgi:hypothetical protein